MKAESGYFRLSATDLSNHLACHHLTSLDLAVAAGERPAPKWTSPDLWILQQRGMQHEDAYLGHLKKQGLAILALHDVEVEKQALEETCAAMRKGVDVIAQATLSSGRWFGRSDVLRRVEKPSKLGGWSYEVYDCKLALETKAATILQLALYSELLAFIQEAPPEWMYVVTPAQNFQPEPYRVLDFAAYYRYIKARLEKAAERNAGHPTSPEPNPHCPVCRWWVECDAKWRKDDHLSLVAGITKLQQKQLQAWDTTTVAQLARLPVPLQQRPDHGSKDGYVRVREQARIQVASRASRQPVHELLEVLGGRGFSRLPDPSDGDVFFDLEGDPFVRLGGQEYLFGLVAEGENGIPIYDCRWAMTPEHEKQAFEWFVDLMVARWRQHPAMHIYHYASYEPSALKRLMGRYATREDEIDRMLRAGLLVDLHTIVKQAVRASVEQYSLKALEIFHGFERAIALDDSRQAMRKVEHGLELGRSDQLDEDVVRAIQTYNADDCLSTRALRIWLEDQRRSLEEAGQNLPRPVVSDGAPAESVNERQQRVATLVAELRVGISLDPKERTEELAGRWLLANLLDWHRREDKADWWEFFRLKDLPEEDLLDESCALSGLSLLKRVGLDGKFPIDRYNFPKQETDVRDGDKVCQKGEAIGEVIAIDMAERTVDIKKTKKTAALHPTSICVDVRGPRTDILADALFRLGTWVKHHGLDGAGTYGAGRGLVLRRAPRTINREEQLIRPGESTIGAAKRIAIHLDHSVLAIQGPPGTGKTSTGAEMICELIRHGKKVGVTAVSHKVIRNLLDRILTVARESGHQSPSCMQKLSGEPELDPPPGIGLTTSNAEALAAIQNGSCHVLGGTAWLWSRGDFFESVDVLFIDEAGQMSLANVLAASQASRSVVLLGDPQQLEQPLRGSHPEGAEASALEHLLAGAKTIPADKGLFLEKTWRLHPKICEFTSEVFYEGRLQSHEGLERQSIEGHQWLNHAGMWFVPVQHEGNQNASPEEVERIASLVEELLRSQVKWIDRDGKRRALRLDDVLIVAPYNAQVSDLLRRLHGARVGTVDKFQGQEAPIVIYSLTTSSPEDAPRGMEFLYSLNRLNVATSRARAIVLLVGSPRLLEPACRSPRQMQLANSLCRYRELAHCVEDYS
jgi:predicted RecB family nuclease